MRRAALAAGLPWSANGRLKTLTCRRRCGGAVNWRADDTDSFARCDADANSPRCGRGAATEPARQAPAPGRQIYFDQLPHNAGSRARSRARSAAREFDKPTVMQLERQVHAAAVCAWRCVIDRIEAEAKHNVEAALALGGIHSDRRAVQAAASMSIADRKGWRPTIIARTDTKASARLRSHDDVGSWRAPGSSNIRNPSATAMIISSR